MMQELVLKLKGEKNMNESIESIKCKFEQGIYQFILAEISPDNICENGQDDNCDDVPHSAPYRPCFCEAYPHMPGCQHGPLKKLPAVTSPG